MADYGLKQFPLFAGLTPAGLEKLSALLQEQSFAAGEEIFREGTPGGVLYLIKEGRVQISLLIQGLVNAHEKVTVLKEGDFFGELSLFDGKEHSARAAALEKSTLLTLSREDFRQIIRDEPGQGVEIQEQIILSLIRIIREINTRYADLSGYIAT